MIVSLPRALSKLGCASRSKALGLIGAGRVAVNGRVVADPGARVCLPRDRIAIDGSAVAPAERRCIALNKPRGLVTTTSDERGRATVYECLRNERDRRLMPVGRLDKASEGLLLFTSDTRWAQHLLDPASQTPKTYHVQVNRVLTDDECQRLQRGVRLDDGTCARPTAVSVLRSGGTTCWLEITLCEGHNREIRRMLETVGAEVLRLVRVAIGPVRLGTLAKGSVRELTQAEVRSLSRGSHA